MSTLDDLQQNVIAGNVSGTEALVRQALEDGTPAEAILKQGLIAAMSQVGKLFEEGECFVPDMLVAARAMKRALQLLRPALLAAKVQPLGTVVIGTVHGDLHDIGKNLVATMMEGAGFEVIDLGADVAPEAFVAAVKRHQPALLGLSALLTTTMPKMKATIEALSAAGVRGSVKVMIGGAPVTEGFAQEIGADIFAPDASAAAARARQAVSGAPGVQ
jgi:5-methyltetrahydrofolate--homocysteine methyltransferase